MLTACSNEAPDDEAASGVPKPIEIVEDDSTTAASPTPPPASEKRYAEFECVSGAKPITDLPSEADANGVVYYDPTDVRVFGLQARAIERIDAGDEGVAVYFSENKQDLVAAIQTVHPEYRANRERYSGGGYNGDDRFMSIGPATNGLLRFVCLTYAYGGE